MSTNRLPPNYFSDLLAEALASTKANTSNTSNSSLLIPNTNIFELQDPSISDSPIRVGSITALLPLSRNHERVFDLHMPIVAYIAMQDFNNRRSVFLDQDSLSTIRDCNFYLGMTFRDSAFDPNVAIREFIDQFLGSTSTSTSSFAALGPVLSHSAAPVATLAAATKQGIITMSPASGSELLENRDAYPYFTRTHTYSLGQTSAVIAYLHSIGVEHLTILYVDNDYGRGYLQTVTRASQKYAMQIHIASYRDFDIPSMVKAAQLIQQFPTTFHFCISSGTSYRHGQPLRQYTIITHIHNWPTVTQENYFMTLYFSYSTTNSLGLGTHKAELGSFPAMLEG